MGEEINNFSSAKEMVQYLSEFNTIRTGFKDRFKRVYIFREHEFEKHYYPYTGSPFLFKYTIEKVGNEFHFKTQPDGIDADDDYTIRFVKEIPNMAESLSELWLLQLKPSIYLVFQSKANPEATPTILQL